MQEVTPPIIDTGPTIPPVDVDPTGGSAVIIVAVVLAFIIVGMWWYRNNLQKEIQLYRILHFNLEQFNQDTEGIDLGEYNRKYGLLILIGVFSMFGVPAAASAVVPYTMMSFRAVIMVMGWVMVAMFLWNFVRQLTEREVRDNMNAIWGTTELYVPGVGSYSKTWRKIENPQEVLLSKEENIALVDTVMTTAEEAGLKFAEAFKDKKLTETAAKKQAKETMLKSLMSHHAYRVSIQTNYRCLLIFNHEWNEVVNPNTDEMFNRTTDVTIRRIPMTAVYIGESKRIFRDLDSKGHPIMGGVTMGVFMIVIDRKVVEKALLSGRFYTPNAQDAMFARMVHQHEQDVITVEYVNQKLVELAKKEKELNELKHKKVVEGQTQFNVYVRGFNRLFEPIGGKQKVSSLLMQGLVFGAIWFAIFYMFGWIR